MCSKSNFFKIDFTSTLETTETVKVLYFIKILQIESLKTPS